MQESYITEIKIKQVRHLHDISIPINKEERTHLILTGKNGSGKTSVLEALRDHLEGVINGNFAKSFAWRSQIKSNTEKILKGEELLKSEPLGSNRYIQIYQEVNSLKEQKEQLEKQISIFEKVNVNIYSERPLIENHNQGVFIITYFDITTRVTKYFKKSEKVPAPIPINDGQDFDNKIGAYFEQFLVNQRFNQLLAMEEDNKDQYNNINRWFSSFEKNLARIFEVDKLALVYDRTQFQYLIKIDKSNNSTLQTLPSGYASIINILAELFMRMDNEGSPAYDQQGIVLIDEIDAHLHIDLQKNILPFLTSLFPKIQFIVSTHSPFILNSLQNAVVYDLEKQIRIEDLSRYSIDGIVETYFDSDKYSNEVKKEIEEYEQLVFSTNLELAQKDRMYDLKRKLKKIPAHLAPELVSRFQQIESKRLAANHG